MTGATVLSVLRHECSVVSDRRCPHFVVRLAFESAIRRIVHGGNVVASRSELFGDGWSVHLVEQ